MRRRDFLKHTAVATVALPVSPQNASRFGQGSLERRAAPKRVIIVGAGLAGWHVNGREELRDAMRPIAEHLRTLGADGLSTDVTCGSDECPFLLEGIPALKLWVDTAQYREVHHKASDTFDKVDALLFRAGGAVVAVTTYALAEQPRRLAPHIGQDAVPQILRDTRLDVDLVYAMWRP
jgi:hypothetical protein